MMRPLIQSTLLILFFVTLIACNPANAATTPKLKQSSKHPRVALVLGEGGTRGYAHIGVLKVLKQAGVPIDLIVGASAGSIVGSLYADDPNPKRLQKMLLNANFWYLLDISNFSNLKGFATGKHLKQFLHKNMKARYFKQLKIKLIIVATDLRTGKTIPFESGLIAPAVAASTAVPGVFRPVKLRGHILVDGGMGDPVPVDIALRYHPKVIIAVNIAKNLPKQMPTTAWGIYQRGYLISWLKMAKMNMRGANVIIHPHVGETGVFDFSERRAMLKAGEDAARKALPKILSLMKKNHIQLTKPLNRSERGNKLRK